QNLTKDQNAALERARDEQAKVAERMDQLLGQMRNVSQERQEKDPDTADSLRQAAELAEEKDILGQMRRASEDLNKNQIAKATNEQRGGTQGLEKLVQNLEERREAELDRLKKKLQQAEEKMADLIEKQEQLQKKMREAEKISDAAKREQELKRLAREQEELR